MALILCVKCSKQISDKCTKCPHCGNEDSEQIEKTRKTELLERQLNDMTREERVLRMEWHVAFALTIVSLVTVGLFSWIHGFYMWQKLRWLYFGLFLGALVCGIMTTILMLNREFQLARVFMIIGGIVLLTTFIFTIIDIIKLSTQRSRSNYQLLPLLP